MLGSRPKLLLVLILTLCASCFPSTTGERPNVESEYFYYPIGAGLTQPDGEYLLVASSNFDLLYNSALVVPIELETLVGTFEACRSDPDGAGCPDFIVTREEDVDDEGGDDYEVIDYLLGEHSVYIGSYASSMTVTEEQVYIPVRSDASLHYVDVAEVDPENLDSERILRCDWGEGANAPTGVQNCGSERAISSGRRLRDDDVVSVPADPYAVQSWTAQECTSGEEFFDPQSGRCSCVSELPSECDPDDADACGDDDSCLCNGEGGCYCASELPETCDITAPDCPEGTTCRCQGDDCLCLEGAFCAQDFVVVGHMVTGEVSLFERQNYLDERLPRSCGDGDDNDGNGFTDFDDPGCQGASMRLIDVSEAFVEGTTGITVDPNGRFLITSRFEPTLSAFTIESQQISPSKTIAVSAVSTGDNQRGIALSPDGQRAFVLSRAPESVLVLDISVDENGDYVDEFIDVVEIGNGPSIIRIHEDESSADGFLIYVVCFEEDRIFVVDPAVNEVIDVITTRRGPHDLVFDDRRGIAYLVNFLESTISVLDMRPDEAGDDTSTHHTILTTLGMPRRPRSND